jgi:hypothetical protein
MGSLATSSSPLEADDSIADADARRKVKRRRK